MHLNIFSMPIIWDEIGCRRHCARRVPCGAIEMPSLGDWATGAHGAALCSKRKKINEKAPTKLQKPKRNERSERQSRREQRNTHTHTQLKHSQSWNGKYTKFWLRPIYSETL